MKIQTYLSMIAQDPKIPENRKDYIKICLKQEPWDVHVGLIAFHEDGWAIGCGFPGNYSVFNVTDFRKYERRLGRKKTGPENDCVYVDQPDMDKFFPVPLKTKLEIRADELEYSRRSIYCFPHRFHKHFDLTVKVQGEICGRSALTDEEIAILEGLMTAKEHTDRNRKLNDVHWSDEESSVEMPIRIRISGIDDGAAHKLYATVEDAMGDAAILEGKVWTGGHEIFDLGFKRTD